VDEITLRPGVRAEARDDDAYMALMGEVGYDIEPKEVAAALRHAKGKPLTVDIFSYGGDAMAGLAIHQMLAAHDAEVTTNILGIAASAASLIAMGGTKRRCAQNAAMMIHQAWAVTAGDADDHRKSADVLEGITAAYLRTYSEASGRPVSELEPYVREESWLYGEDAFALGLVTEVTEPIAAMASARAVPASVFAKIPDDLRSLIQQPVVLSKSEAAPAVVDACEPELVDSIEPENPAEVAPAMAASPVITMTEINEAAVAAQSSERERVKAIRGLMKQHEMPETLCDEMIENGASVEAAQVAVLDRIATSKGEFRPGAVVDTGKADLGLSASEVKRYSLMNVINYLADRNPRTAQAASFELEVSKAAEAHHHKSASGIIVPWDVLRGGPRAAAETPGQTVGVFGDGGALVGSQRLDASFIDLIRNRSAFLNSGITMLTGLEGNVEIPKKLGSSAYYFVGENVDVTNSRLTFGLVNMIPRTIGVRVPISRRMMIQASPDIDSLVRSDMAESVALGIDYTTAYGTGSNGQPLGIINTAGIGSVTLTGGISKTFPANLGGGSHTAGEWNNYVDLETELAADNLDIGAMRYIGNSVVRGALKQTLRAASAGSDYVIRDDSTVNGYQFAVSNQLQTNDVLFGNFADAVVGMWSGLDLTIDPYTQSANGQVILTVLQDFDVAVRRQQSFALGT
jgi:HK97 family phage major capsid protein